MCSSNRFQISLILFAISALRMIESTPTNNSSKLPPLCYENSERLVRTPSGYRCVLTKRSNEKRSTVEAELSSQETDLSDTKSDTNNNNEHLIKEEDLNSVIPVAEPLTLSAKYKKIVIKNNRGPWKIDNMIFKRSPHFSSAQKANDSDELFERIASKEDGLLVSKHLINETNIKSLPPKMATFGLNATAFPKSFTSTPLISEASIEEKFIKNLPKINLFTKIVDKKNLRNFKFNSDIDVIDLIQEDSILQSHSFSDNKTFVVNVMSADRRKTRSPPISEKNTSEESMDQLKSEEKSEQTFAPIRIFVFLNRNRNKNRDQSTESSDNRFNIARRPHPRKASFDLNSDLLRTSTSTTTSLTTTTTTPKTTTMTTTSIPIKRVLKKLDLNEFDERMSSELWNIDDLEEKVEEPYVEPTESSIGEYFSLTAAPISRNWNFICGKRRGFYADIENDCRTYYQCSVRGRQRWECPPGTKFNQFSSTCDWMENVDCLSFKELINDKTSVQKNNDLTTATTPFSSSPITSQTTTTTPFTYEPDYEDAFEE